MNYLNEIYQILADLRHFKITGQHRNNTLLPGGFRSKKDGDGFQFNQYQHYQPGESIQGIDWKVYARTDKLYTRRYEQESNRRFLILVDSSKSMQYHHDGRHSKHHYSTIFAGALGYLLLENQDTIAYLIPENQTLFTGYKSGKRAFIPLFQQFSAQSTPQTPLEQLNTLEKTRALHNTTICIFSDFLFELEPLFKQLGGFVRGGTDLILLQTLDPGEIVLNYHHPIRFVDMETEEMILTDPDAVRDTYQTELRNHNKQLEQFAIGYNSRYILCDTKTAITNQLLNLFKG